MSIGTVDQDDPKVAGAHRMSSFQNPVRFLGVTTLLCCTLFGCASKQGFSPAGADSSPEASVRKGFLAAETSVTPTSSQAPVDQSGQLEPGTSPDAESINAILDEMLAGHQALKARKADDAGSEPSSSGSSDSPASDSDHAAVRGTEPGEIITVAAPRSSDSTQADLESDLNDALPRIEPSTEMVRALLASAARSDAPLKQHLALAMLMAWVTPEKPFEPSGLTELTEQERIIVSIVYEHFKSLGSELDDGGGEEDLLEALTGIIDAVEDESPFQISRMELCSWVRDFGDVDVIEPLTFSPKERPRFIWYVELDGVSPTQNASTGEWAHEFDVKVEVLTKDTGIPVISPIVDRVRYSSSSRLRDLFLRNMLEIPQDLQFDWYTTKVTITEIASGIRSQKSLDLLWVPNLAAGEAHFLRHASVDE
ncbi:MAG TPA: hypothetical protein DCX60_03150 [Phycisphaerales bacterium]|nr:hypothetical protein [Phycisphaerales bacterium]